MIECYRLSVLSIAHAGFNSVVFIFNLAIVENKHEMVTISNQYRMSYDPIREKTINAAIPRQKIFWASSETNK